MPTDRLRRPLGVSVSFRFHIPIDPRISEGGVTPEKAPNVLLAAVGHRQLREGEPVFGAVDVAITRERPPSHLPTDSSRRQDNSARSGNAGQTGGMDQDLPGACFSSVSGGRLRCWGLARQTPCPSVNPVLWGFNLIPTGVTDALRARDCGFSFPLGARARPDSTSPLPLHMIVASVSPASFFQWPATLLRPQLHNHTGW